jgi:polar amino acid transport system substrate-binding protein
MNKRKMMLKPMNLIFVLFSCLLVAFGLSGCTASSNASKSDPLLLVVGLSADYPPFEFKKNGEVVGFDVDVAQAIAKELGYSLSIQDMDFSALIPALQSGRIDFAMSGMTITEERKKNVDFSDPYFTASFSIIVDQASSFSKEEDLQGKRIGAQLGSTMEKYAKTKAKVYSGMQIVALGKNPLLIQELKSGRIDGMISEDVQAVSFVQANPTLKQIRLSSTGDGYAIAFPKANTKNAQFKEQVNAALKKLTTSGQMAEIQKKWLGK